MYIIKSGLGHYFQLKREENVQYRRLDYVSITSACLLVSVMLNYK